MKMIPEEDEPEGLWKKEEIEVKLQKIDDLQMQINGLKVEIEQIKRRITRLQDQKGDTGCSRQSRS
ncbi:unnamed protein product [marine sediment metagenome]|uniref:Uncharacterized protein n=1 Tax=marine sediment metagenome TaxID=412755 RepID=X1ABU8_9ZZZZ